MMNMTLFTEDHFITVDMNLPERIIQTRDTIQHFLENIAMKHKQPVPEFSIAGGCLSNHYMGKPIRDIDIFIEHFEWMEEEMTGFHSLFGKLNLQHKVDTKEMRYQFIENTALLRYENEDEQETELIFCTNLKRLYDFDLRFRQFYLYNNIIYTTPGTLEDIRNQKITVSSPTTPLSTLYRMIHFEESLGFSIDPDSWNEIRWLISLWNFDFHLTEKLVNNTKKFSERTRELILKEIKNIKESEEEIPSPYSDLLTSFFQTTIYSTAIDKNINQPFAQGILGLHYEKLKHAETKMPTKQQIYKLPLIKSMKHFIFSKFEKSLIEFVKKQRLTMFFDDPSNFKKYYTQTILQYEKNGDFDEILPLFEMYPGIFEKLFSSFTSWLQETNNPLYKNISFLFLMFQKELCLYMDPKIYIQDLLFYKDNQYETLYTLQNVDRADFCENKEKTKEMLQENKEFFPIFSHILDKKENWKKAENFHSEEPFISWRANTIDFPFYYGPQQKEFDPFANVGTPLDITDDDLPF